MLKSMFIKKELRQHLKCSELVSGINLYVKYPCSMIFFPTGQNRDQRRQRQPPRVRGKHCENLRTRKR